MERGALLAVLILGRLVHALGTSNELRDAPASLATDLAEVLVRISLADGFATLGTYLLEELRAVTSARGLAALASGLSDAHVAFIGGAGLVGASALRHQAPPSLRV